MTAPRLRIGVATAALRGLADALEEVAIPEGRVATRREVERIVAEATAVTRLLRGAPRACATCGNPITRKRYDDGHLESPADYARRQYCDRTCKGKAIRHKKVDTPRNCSGCHAPITQRPGEDWARYQRRATCGDPACILQVKRNAARKHPKPKPTPTPATATPKQATAKATPPAHREPTALPDPRPTHSTGTGRVRPLGEPCPKHPSNTIGFFGCPACNAHAKWREGERRVTHRPHYEGGR